MNAPSWLVRPPKLGDAAPLAAIATAVSPHNNPISPNHITRTIQQANGRFWTITHQQQPIGYAALLPIPGLPNLFELSGGIAPEFQRQGAGSFLWQLLKQDVQGTAVHHITHTVSDLNNHAALFLHHHQFELEHEEWTMELPNLQAHILPSPTMRLCHLQQADRETAVRTLPDLYQRCFSGTPWFQPYTAAEIAATWEPTDQSYYLMEDDAPIGFVWLHADKDGTTEIEPVGIVREKQGMGYGRILLTTVLKKLQTQAVATVSLGVWVNNHIAIQLYQKLGFRHVSSSYNLVYTLPQT